MATPYEDRYKFITDTAAAAPGVVNLFKDRHTINTESGTPKDNASADSIIQQLMAQATNPDQYKALVDSIQQRAAINFAPVTAEQTSSGGYNSTTLQLLQNDAKARATAEATQAVTNAERQSAQIAANLQAEKLRSNRQQSQTIKAPFDAAALIKSLGASFAFNQLAKRGIDKFLSLSKAKATPGNIEGSGSVDTVPYGGFQDTTRN